jgi:ABC-2 type transport system permease protein
MHSINFIGLWTILAREIHRTRQVLFQAVLSPTLSTVLYFVVFGAAIGTNVFVMENISYGQFIVPGLIVMAVITNALSASSSGIYFPRFTGTITDLIVAPLSYREIVLGYALGGTIRALFIGMLVYISSLFFIDITISHPIFALLFITLSAFVFSLLGIVIGIWAKDFERLALVPLIIVTPLSFLGGVFYTLEMLPPLWQKITIFNPIYYMVDGFRYTLFGTSTTDPFLSLSVLFGIVFALWFLLAHMFSKGYGMKT